MSRGGRNLVARSHVRRHSMQSYFRTCFRLRKREHLITLGSHQGALNFCIRGTPPRRWVGGRERERGGGGWWVELYTKKGQNGVIIIALCSERSQAAAPVLRIRSQSGDFHSFGNLVAGESDACTLFFPGLSSSSLSARSISNRRSGSMSEC